VGRASPSTSRSGTLPDAAQQPSPRRCLDGSDLDERVGMARSVQPGGSRGARTLGKNRVRCQINRRPARGLVLTRLGSGTSRGGGRSGPAARDDRRLHDGCKKVDPWKPGTERSSLGTGGVPDWNIQGADAGQSAPELRHEISGLSSGEEF
jgi:hypothetical protein